MENSRVSQMLGLYLLVGIIICASFISPTEARSQAGGNAVCTAQSRCLPTAASPAFIDAVGYGNGSDLCDVIYGIFNNRNPNAPTYPSTGAVIDARGLTSLTCSLGTPWSENGAYVNVPATILLPSGTIKISSTWILPNNTKLIGEETTDPALNNNGSTAQTTIQATSGLSSGAIIQFGDSTHCPSSVCTGISVEHLTLYGNGNSLIGIQNLNSQDLSYVDHVTLYHVLGKGLVVSGSAQNSGPYTNINYDTGGSGVSGSVCAQINGLSATRGIHGLSCVSSPDSQTAVLLDSSNNTLKDVRIVGFFDGILVGSQAPAQSNVLLNIAGDTASGGLLPPVHVVHISKSSNPVTDLSIMGANNVLGSPQDGEYSVADDVTSTYLGDKYVAMYALGQSKNNGYSRYTSSPNAATWAFGNNKPTGGCATGSVYSCLGGASACKSGLNSFALWGCVNSAWSGIK